MNWLNTFNNFVSRRGFPKSFALLLILASGCAVRSNGFHGLYSQDGLSAAWPGDAHELALDVARELGRLYAPGQTSLGLVEASGQFQDSLEQSLRNQGFAVSEPPASVNIATITDVIDFNRGYAQVQTSDGQRFSLSRRLRGGSLPRVEVTEFMASPLPEPAVEPVAMPAVERLEPAEKAGFTPEKEREIYSESSQSETLATRTMLLPKAILRILPASWKYTVLDPDKRQLKVTPPANIGWREALANMAAEVQCAADFDDGAKRVSFKNIQVTPSVTTPDSPVATALAAASQSEQIEPVVPITPVEPANTLPVQASVSEIWQIQPGSLYGQLETWAGRAGYQVVWLAVDDLNMQAAASFTGTFLDCLQQLFTGLIQAGYNLRLTVYQSNKVLEIRSE